MARVQVDIAGMVTGDIENEFIISKCSREKVSHLNKIVLLFAIKSTFIHIFYYFTSLSYMAEV